MQHKLPAKDKCKGFISGHVNSFQTTATFCLAVLNIQWMIVFAYYLKFIIYRQLIMILLPRKFTTEERLLSFIRLFQVPNALFLCNKILPNATLCFALYICHFDKATDLQSTCLSELGEKLM